MAYTFDAPYTNAPFDIVMNFFLVNQLDGVTDLYAPIKKHKPNQCRSKNGVCPQCYLNNIFVRVNNLKDDTEKLFDRLTGGRFQYQNANSEESTSAPEQASEECEIQTQTNDKTDCATQTNEKKEIATQTVEACEKKKHCKDSICPQCFLKQIAAAEDELAVLRKTIDDSEQKTMSSKTGNEINDLRNRLTSLEEEIKKFKKLLLEAVDQVELRNDCWIARRTTTAKNSTFEFIRNIFHIPRILTNMGKLDGLN